MFMELMNPFDVLAAACYLAVVGQSLLPLLLGKALDPEGTVRGARSLGLPESFSRATRWALPVIEGIAYHRPDRGPAPFISRSSWTVLCLHHNDCDCTSFAEVFNVRMFRCPRAGCQAKARHRRADLVFVAAAGLATVANHTSATRLAAGIVVAASVVICVPLAAKLRRVAGAYDTTPPPAAPVTYALVVEQACPLCDRLLQHLAGILTGKEPLVLVIRGKDSGRSERACPCYSYRKSIAGPSADDVPCAPALEPEGLSIALQLRSPTCDRQQPSSLPEYYHRNCRPIEPDERGCVPCKAYQVGENP